MKNSIKKFLCICLTFALCGHFTSVSAAAAEVQNTQTAAAEQSTETAAETPALPESYNWPIQSNEVPGWPQGPQVQAETAIVMEASTGAILYAKNIDEARYPASITKIMTTLLAIEHCSLDEQVTFSENAIWGIERDSSHIGIKIGEVLTMEQCLYGMMLESANEVCIAVAEHIAGSVDAFAQMMNDKAAQLGCTNTHFVNANGLHDDNHYTTAHDMALISQAALQNETFRQVTGSTHYIIPVTNLTPEEERWLNNHHKMLQNTEYHYDGCIGGKTGYTSMAGNTLVTFAERDGIQLICVVMKDAGAAIYTDTTALLDYGFTSFQKVTLAEGGELKRAPLLDCEYPALRDCFSTSLGNTSVSFAAMIPTDASADALVTTETAEAGEKITTYTFNEQTVGRIVTNINKVLPEPAAESDPESSEDPVSEPEEAPSEILSSTEASDPGDLLSTFQNLPAWKYPVLLLLIWAVLFYLISLVLHIKRKSKAKKSKKKDKEYKESLHENYEPFLTEEKILDETLLPPEEDPQESTEPTDISQDKTDTPQDKTDE
ncbi:MAG: D-alanyl-D-alanine carboxypeptidase family protein [Lachnospiraceae bacterium]|jgi:D-alanyl-D-alanine carboxypeptidase (penicillin-binding protein 5/6)